MQTLREMSCADVVVMSVAEDCTFDKRIDAHSKTLMEPNFVLFWDLRDSSHPQVEQFINFNKK